MQSITRHIDFLQALSLIQYEKDTRNASPHAGRNPTIVTLFIKAFEASMSKFDYHALL
jgi:hypothetical protein